MAFTDSALQVAQERLDNIYATPNISTPEMLEGSASTARFMLANQRSRTVPRATNGECVGWEGWYFRPNAEEHSATTAPNSCDIPTGAAGETLKGEYANAVLARTDGVLQTNRCDNLLSTAEEMEKTIMHMMVKLRKYLSRGVIIPGITAAAQVNLDTMIDTAVFDTTTDSPRILAEATAFTFENLNEFNILAENNNFGDFFWLSGRLFNDNKWMAMLNSANEGFRNEARAWAEQQINFDTRDLDQVMTKKTAFAVDRNSYAFWNYSPYTSEAREVYDRHWVWAQADPILQWNFNGRLVPVMYAFEMKEACAQRVSTTEVHQSTIRLYGRLVGGFEFAPTGPNDEKGVLEFGIEAI